MFRLADLGGPITQHFAAGLRQAPIAIWAPFDAAAVLELLDGMTAAAGAVDVFVSAAAEVAVLIRLPQAIELVADGGGKVCVVGREAELAAFVLATLLQPLSDDLLDYQRERACAHLSLPSRTFGGRQGQWQLRAYVTPQSDILRGPGYARGRLLTGLRVGAAPAADGLSRDSKVTAEFGLGPAVGAAVIHDRRPVCCPCRDDSGGHTKERCEVTTSFSS